jgi:hypothetical protein
VECITSSTRPTRPLCVRSFCRHPFDEVSKNYRRAAWPFDEFRRAPSTIVCSMSPVLR